MLASFYCASTVEYSMGLLYQFPLIEENTGKVIVYKDKDERAVGTTLMTYGMSYSVLIFLILLLVIVKTGVVLIRGPLHKLTLYSSPEVVFFAYLVMAFIISIPIIISMFFFYQKRLTKIYSKIVITHKIFALPISTKTYHIPSNDNFIIEKTLKKNKDFYELWLILEDGNKIFVDRYPSKEGLEKIKNLLLRY